MLRIFVGTSSNGEDAEAECVLAWTIKKHCSVPFEIVWMRQSKDPASFWHGWNTSRWATPFSAFRAGLPAYCDYQGKAIYCDVDIWFQADPAELFNQAFKPGKVVMAKGGGSWRLCVSLWDCAAAKRWLPAIEDLKADPAALSRVTKTLITNSLIMPFVGDWNCLDGGEYTDLADPQLKALHYTDMSTQPHLAHALPRLKATGGKHWFDGTVKPHRRPDVQARFDALLAEATEAGEGVDKFIPAKPFGSYKKASLAHYKGAPK